MNHQIFQVREGGIAIVFRKVKRLGREVKKVPYILIALPIVVVIRALRPLVTIRIGSLRSDRIGHFAGNTEIYLSERELGMHGNKTHDVFYILPPVCNEQLRKMWERTLNVFPFAYYLSLANRCLPGASQHTGPMCSTDKDYNNVVGRTNTHLRFTHAESALGEQNLREMGVPEDAPFVCFIGRDSLYLDACFPQRKWDYHNYRDMDIQNFVPAVEELVKCGYWVIRMGHIVKEALVVNNAQFIDYASKYRTELMDLYLCSKCHFFVDGGSGMRAVPIFLFRRPTIEVNFTHFESILGGLGGLIFIPKKLWLIQERRFMTMREMFQWGVIRFSLNDQYKKVGVEPIENTSEEIASVIVEMEERLKGTWQTTEENEALQNRFWDLFKFERSIYLNEIKQENTFRTRIGAEFLFQNQEMLK